MAYKDPTRKAAYMKIWRANHPEYAKEKWAKYSEEKHEELRAKQTAYILKTNFSYCAGTAMLLRALWVAVRMASLGWSMGYLVVSF